MWKNSRGINTFASHCTTVDERVVSLCLQMGSADCGQQLSVSNLFTVLWGLLGVPSSCWLTSMLTLVATVRPGGKWSGRSRNSLIKKKKEQNMSLGKIHFYFCKTRLPSEKTRISWSSRGFLTFCTNLHQYTLLALSHLKSEGRGGQQ